MCPPLVRSVVSTACALSALLGSGWIERTECYGGAGNSIGTGFVLLESKRARRVRRMKGFKSSMRVPVSILDLAQVGHSETPSDSFKASVDLAVRAEKWGYRRIWYAEHHNISRIASSATSVLIAAQTRGLIHKR